MRIADAMNSEKNWLVFVMKAAGGRRRNGTDSIAFELVDRVDIVGVYDARGAESAEKLRYGIDGKPSPWKSAKEAESHRDGGIEETAAVTCDVNS
ncbi:hypothetical protein M7I_6722 [Glarea lozoyensis 74030]|uniref:Uncharacterized protein n=1 Tax=Glarea lozoyensis (strain ATCC 74030 / MF5533) TaxID=1104152 RepID=H0EVC5_GLAL7|nr:hypothetical protein M7I_6722 [Glarea lozoyensis 74030]